MLKLLFQKSKRVINKKREVKITVGCKNILEMANSIAKQDCYNDGRVVEVLGFSNTFCTEPIVRYEDTKIW